MLIDELCTETTDETWASYFLAAMLSDRILFRKRVWHHLEQGGHRKVKTEEHQKEKDKREMFGLIKNVPGPN